MNPECDGGLAARVPLLWPVAAFVAGLLLARTDLLPLAPALALAGALCVAALWLRRAAWALALLLGFGLGVADLWQDARAVLAGAEWTGERRIEARVAKVEPRIGYRRLWLEDVRLLDGGRALPGRALLYLRGRQPVREGDRLQARVRLRPPENARNPGAFDWRAWCFDRRIGWLASPIRRVIITPGDTPWAGELRARIRQALEEGGAAHPAGRSVVAALLLGDRGGIPPEAMHAFAATGAAHLLAISGLHVGMVGAMGFALAWWLLTRREGWIVRLPVRRIAMLAALLAACGYAWLAGWPPPAVRAGLMMAAGVLAWWLGARAHLVQTLLAALGLMLLADPGAVASVSLWLSFAATWAIVVWAGRGRREDGWIRRAGVWLAGMMAVSMLAFLATLPWIAAVFGRLPAYSLPVNLAALPWFGVAVLPLSLAGELAALGGADALAHALLAAASGAADALVRALEQAAALPGANLHGAALPVAAHAAAFLAFSVCGWLWLRGRRWPAAAGAVFALALYAGAMLHERWPDAPRWMIWDVGQGAASCLVTPEGGVLALDAPGRAGSRFTGGDRAADAMRAMGLLHADWVVVSHAQSDHMGGIAALMRGLNRIGGLALPDTPATRASRRAQALVRWARVRGIPVRFLARGDVLAIPGARIEALWPPRGWRGSRPNDGSLVLRARLDDGRTLLWPGDIEQGAERRLLASGRLDAVDALLAPHHGSRTSSTPAFVARTSPRLVVAQAGRRNRYRFPAPEVVARWRQAGGQVRNTAEGAVIVALDARPLRAGIRQWPERFSERRALAVRLAREWMHFSGRLL